MHFLNPFWFPSGVGGPPESMFGSGTPSGATFDFSYELGMRFYADVAGSITKIRVYWPTAGGTSGQTGAIWSAAGSSLATANFGTMTEGAWNEVTLASPLAITAATIYTVSCPTALPNYRAFYTTGYFPTNNGSHLFSAASGVNGVFGAGSLFPTGDGAGQNYWRDVEFQPD